MTEQQPEKNEPPPPETSQEAVSIIQKELKECQEKYLRMLAETENARKRMQKELQETMKYAVENVLVEFLHPIDSLEKALQFAEAMSPEVKNWAVGFEMLLNQFKQILQQHGVHEYHSIGKPFDPHFHEAVEMVVSTEYPPGVVIDEFVRGYKIGDKPIRVARVKVAKAPEQEVKEENKSDKD